MSYYGQKTVIVGHSTRTNRDFTQRVSILHRKISVKVLISRPAVHKAIEKYNEDGTYLDKPRSGRPRKTTPREDHIMRRTEVRLPNSSCKKVQANLLRHGTEVSVQFHAV